MGSISFPEGVNVSGYSWQQILDEITQQENLYNTSVSNFTTRRDNYEEAETQIIILAYDVLTARATYGEGSQEYADAVAAFDAYKSTYDNRYSLYYNQLGYTTNRATTYVSALARKQLFTQETTQEEIDAIVNSILSETPPEPLTDTEIPSFPWLTQYQRNMLPQDISDREQAATDLLNAFNAYRYLEWQIADKRKEHIRNWQTYVKTWVEWARNPTTANETIYQNAQAAYNTTLSELNALTTQRTSVRNTLDSAISEYESEFLFADDRLVNVINSIKQYANNYDDVIAAIEDEVQQELIAAQETFDQLEAGLQAAHYSQYPSTNFSFTHEAINEAVARAMHTLEGTLSTSYNRPLTAADIPELPPSTANLSMSQLMKLISQINIMIQELIRQAANADRWVNSFRLNLARQNLSLLGRLSQAQDLWNQEVYAADLEYNTIVESANEAIYTDFVQIYENFQENIDVINDVIEEINDEIEAYNELAQDLVDGVNTIRDDIISAINAEREDVPNINYLDFYGYDPDVVAVDPHTGLAEITYPVEIPLFDTLSAPDLPELPTDYYPGVSELDTNAVNSINNKIADFLMLIAPFKTRVINALKDELGITDDSELELSQLFLRETLGVRDNREQLSLFESIFAMIFGFIVQIMLLRRIGVFISAEEIGEIINESAKFFSLPKGKELGKTIYSPGVSFALAVAGIIESTGPLGRAINQVMSSETFTRAVIALLDRIAMTAGLEAAGVIPDVLRELSVLGISISELLQEKGINVEELVESQSIHTLIAIFIAHLAQAATLEGDLRTNVVNILSELPELSGISKEELEELINTLILLLQLLLLLLAILLGAGIGITPSQLIAEVFGPITTGEAEMTQLFEGLGIPTNRARELAALVAGRDELQSVLVDMGLDPRTRTILLALIAASEGEIPLTSGVPGGPAFMDTLIAYLRDQGIVLSVDIFSPDFINELVAQLELKATEEQREILRRVLLGAPIPIPLEPLADRLTALAEEFPVTVSRLFAEPPPPAEPPPIIAPSLIMQRLVEEFSRLPESIRAQLIADLEGVLPSITGISTEEKAALLLAIRLQIISIQEAALLLFLLLKEIAGTLSDLETELIRNLFARTEEELKIQEEERKKEILKEEIGRVYTTPSVVPPQTLEQLRVAFESLFRNLSDRDFAVRALENFAKTIENLSDFNAVVQKLILDPAKIILKQFSIITRTPADKQQQPQIFFGG